MVTPVLFAPLCAGASMPEPGSLSLLGTALVGFGVFCRAVLGADRAGELAHHPMDNVVELLPTRQIRLPVGAFRLGRIEVDVAVADMAERHRPDARQPLGDQQGGAVDQLGHAADRYGNIVLDRARIILRFDDRFADPPELLCLRPAFGDDPVADPTRFERRAEQPLEQPANAAVALARRQFEEHIPGIGSGERVDRAGNIGEGETGARDQLERRQLVGGGGARLGEEMLRPSSGGTPPPTRPMLPPGATIGSFASAQIRTTAATSTVEAGRTTSRVAPR